LAFNKKIYSDILIIFFFKKVKYLALLKELKIEIFLNGKRK